MISQQEEDTGVGGKGSQMTSTAGNREGEGKETQGRQVEQTTNRKGREDKKTELILKLQQQQNKQETDHDTAKAS